MTKPKLNIREMIRDGQIDTAKAGQLVTIENYTGEGLLKESDVRALRETAKDAKLYNAYMHGGKELKDCEIALIAISSEAKLGIQKLAWIGAELKYTVETVYSPPRVVAMTDEAYEQLAKERREKRLKRTYTLVTLYRTLAENLIKHPDGKDEEETLANLREYPKDAKEGWIYGIDLIDPDGKGDVIEYWRGWLPYYNGVSQEYDEELGKLETIDKLAEEMPEAHALIMTKLKALHKAKKLSIDLEAVPLGKWHKTPLQGSELAVMESGIKHLQDLLNRPEHTFLDNYKDEGETEEQADNRSIFEKYKQTYAILKNPRPNKLKDGILDIDSLDRPMFWGYRGDDKHDSMGAKAPLEIIRNNREAVNANLHILYALSKWRLKAGKLLGVDKTDRFKETSEALDAIELYNSYEVYRRLLTEHILSETYILPEYRNYTDEIVQTYKPLGSGQTALTDELMHRRGAMDEVLDAVANVFKQDTSVAKALEQLDGIDIYSIEDSFYSFRDTLQPLFSNRRASNDD